MKRIFLLTVLSLSFTLHSNVLGMNKLFNFLDKFGRNESNKNGMMHYQEQRPHKRVKRSDEITEFKKAVDKLPVDTQQVILSFIVPSIHDIRSSDPQKVLEFYLKTPMLDILEICNVAFIFFNPFNRTLTKHNQDIANALLINMDNNKVSQYLRNQLRENQRMPQETQNHFKAKIKMVNAAVALFAISKDKLNPRNVHTDYLLKKDFLGHDFIFYAIKFNSTTLLNTLLEFINMKELFKEYTFPHTNSTKELYKHYWQQNTNWLDDAPELTTDFRNNEIFDDMRQAQPIFLNLLTSNKNKIGMLEFILKKIRSKNLQYTMVEEMHYGIGNALANNNFVGALLILKYVPFIYSRFLEAMAERTSNKTKEANEYSFTFKKPKELYLLEKMLEKASPRTEMISSGIIILNLLNNETHPKVIESFIKIVPSLHPNNLILSLRGNFPLLALLLFLTDLPDDYRAEIAKIAIDNGANRNQKFSYGRIYTQTYERLPNGDEEVLDETSSSAHTSAFDIAKYPTYNNHPDPERIGEQTKDVILNYQPRTQMEDEDEDQKKDYNKTFMGIL